MKTLIKLAKELRKGIKEIKSSDVMIGFVTGCKQV